MAAGRSKVHVAAMLLGLALGLTACATDAPADPLDLTGKTFFSTGAAGHEMVPGSVVRVIFQAGRITVRAGCNTLSGAATWADGTLVIDGPMARTMMACVEDLERQDDWLEAFLRSAPPLRLDGRDLVLGDDDEGLTLVER